MESFDCVIVGGGPAGLTAGLYASRANLKSVLFEKLLPGGQILNTGPIEDYTGFEMILGADLSEKMRDHAIKFGLEIRQEEVTAIEGKGPEFRVKTNVSEYRAKTVIVAAGGTHQKLGIPGEDELSGMGVSYCAVCDGAFFRGQPMVVVGGGDSALEEGLFLTKFATKVTIVHRRDKFRASKILQDRAFHNPKMEIAWDSVLERILGEKEVTGVEIRSLKTGEKRIIPAGACFVFIGFRPNSDIIKEPIEKDGVGYVITNQKMETGVPGLYVVGDLRHQLTKQITTAVGDGTTAAIAAEKFIESLAHVPSAG